MQQIVFALANGSIYALMALAIGMVYSTAGISNFAHASVIMWGAMTSFWFHVVFQWPFIVAILLAVLINVGINMLVYKLCVQGVGDLTKNTGWIVTMFGGSIVLDNIARMIFGTEPQAYPYLFEGKTVHIFGANILLHEILMVVIAIIIGVIYQTLIQRTRFGRAVRAVSYKPDTSRLMGINSELVILGCFGIAGAVAAIGGALIAPITYASYMMTSSIGIKGFAAALLGGLGNTKGAFVGGILLGLIENFIGMLIPPGIRDAISFVIMIIVIIFLPGGILGAKFFSKNKSSAEKI